MTHSPLQGKLLFPFIAPPNGGKGTQTRVLTERYNLPTFDMGATFRAITKGEPDSDLAKRIKQYTDAGQLVPIQTVMEVFKKGFEQLAAQHQNAKGFILDGFPRSLEQANALLQLCQDWGAQIGKAIYLNVPDEVVKNRAVGRRFCTKDAQHVYNILSDSQKPKNKRVENGQDVWLCDVDSEPLEQRADDMPQKVETRLTSFRDDTQPVIDLFRTQGKLFEVNGNQPVQDVTRQITGEIEPVLNLSPSN